MFNSDVYSPTSMAVIIKQEQPVGTFVFAFSFVPQSPHCALFLPSYSHIVSFGKCVSQDNNDDNVFFFLLVGHAMPCFYSVRKRFRLLASLFIYSKLCFFLFFLRSLAVLFKTHLRSILHTQTPASDISTVQISTSFISFSCLPLSLSLPRLSTSGVRSNFLYVF